MAIPTIIYTEKFRLWMHISQVILIIAIIILTIIRLSDKANIPSRAQVMLIVFGIKSLIFIAYQLLTHYKARFIRWASLKANFILNAIDVVFWFTAVILTIMGIAGRCVGGMCVVSWILLLLTMVLTASMGLAAWVCWKDWRVVKNGGRVIPETNSSKYYNGQVV